MRNLELKRATMKAWRARNREYVNACNKKWRDANKEKNKKRIKIWKLKNNHTEKYKGYKREYDKIYYQNNKGKRRAYNIQRKGRIDQATISWHFMPQIEAFYIEARRLTEETGVMYVVDHYWPINGKGSCGLHTPWNLRVVTQAENDSKGNKEPEDTWSSVVLVTNGD